MRLPRPHAAEVLSGLVILVTTLVVLFLIAQQEQSLDRARAQYDALHEDYEMLYDEAIDAGAEPEAPAPDDVPTPEPAQEPSILGPTDLQVLQAVAAYCANGACRGTDGTDGDKPTAADVLAAVTAYCADGRCQGTPGLNGVNGLDGLPGATGEMGAAGATGETGPMGPAGPGPTPEDIAAAVAAYCSTGACTGPQGEKGDTGDTGPEGKPGTTCADGTPPQQIEVMTRNRDGITPTWRVLEACVIP